MADDTMAPNEEIESVPSNDSQDVPSDKGDEPVIAPRPTGKRKPSFDPDQQEIFNKETGRAREEGRRAAVKELLGKLNVSDESELEQAVTRLREKEQAEMTAQERSAAAVKVEEDRRIAAEKKADEAIQTAKYALIYGEVKYQATKHKFHDWNDVVAHLDLEAAEVDFETGSVKGLDKAIAKLAKEKPYLVAVTPEPVATPEPTPPPPPPAVPPTPAPGAAQDVADAERERVKVDIASMVKSWF
jgi:hypothetical protein